MSHNRKLAIAILTIWVVILIGLNAWGISDTFSIFYHEAQSNGLTHYESIFYALRLSSAAAGWIRIPLILGNVPVALLFRHLWRRAAA